MKTAAPFITSRLTVLIATLVDGGQEKDHNKTAIFLEAVNGHGNAEGINRSGEVRLLGLF